MKKTTKKTAKTTKKVAKKSPAVTSTPTTVVMTLDKNELELLRDLFSIVYPLELEKTISGDLAEKTGRSEIEETLWNKVSALCADMGVVVGDDAPYFVVAPSSAPMLGIFELATEEETEKVEQSKLFEGK